MKITITNQELYNEKVDDVELNVVKNSGSFHGDVTINDKTITGEHGSHDYEEEFGFIIE